LAPAQAACDQDDASGSATAAHQPFRIAARIIPRPLGAPELVVEVKFLAWTDQGCFDK
jgi:hypothetical protein